MPVSHPYWDEREMLENNDRPEILAIGDSWFWYPFNNLLNPIFNIWGDRIIFAIGENGAEITDYVGGRFQTQIAETLEAYKRTIKMVIVSGGGNDFAGLDDFDLILKDDCTKANTVKDCYEAGQPKALFDTIENAYRTLILRIRRVIPDAVIVTHNYDYAVPSGKGFIGMGNWLKKPMDLGKVKPALQTPLVNDLIDQLGRRLAKIAKEIPSVHFVKSAGALSAGDWVNELHPRPSGFEKVVKLRWAPVLTSILA
jgi:hypothetical protein